MKFFAGSVLIILSVDIIADNQSFWWRCAAGSGLLVGLYFYVLSIMEQRK